MTTTFEKTLAERPLCCYGGGPGAWVMFRALSNNLDEHWKKADMYLSKSRYLKGLQCPKAMWLLKNEPQAFDSGQMDAGALSYGHEMGDLAKQYFGPYKEVAFEKSAFDQMEFRTLELLEAGTPVICEATFKYDGCLCMVDILRTDADGCAHLVEVKASTRLKDINLHDVAFQAWVVTNWGLPLKSVSIMHVNAQARKAGATDPHELFELVDVTDKVKAMLKDVAGNVEKFRRWASLSKEPGVYMGAQCDSPYPCGFKPWCTKRMQEIGRQ